MATPGPSSEAVNITGDTMDVQMIEKRSVQLASGATHTFPAGWTGQVPNDIAAQWIGEGAAVSVLGNSAQGFTPEQHAILALVADETLRLAGEHQALQGGEGDPTGGEPTDTDEQETEDPAELQLDDLTKVELVELAAGRIDGAARMNKADLVAALKALPAPAAQEEPAA